jgi:hypothetical protein
VTWVTLGRFRLPWIVALVRLWRPRVVAVFWFAEARCVSWSWLVVPFRLALGLLAPALVVGLGPVVWQSWNAERKGEESEDDGLHFEILLGERLICVLMCLSKRVWGEIEVDYIMIGRGKVD